MKIIWHSNQLSFRGTEVGLYNYADAADRILGYTSYIACPRQTSTLEALDKFKDRFEVILYSNLEELEQFARQENVDWTFWIKYGTNDGRLLKSTKNFVQAVFNVNQPHGDVYAYISEWLSLENNNAPYLPRIIHTPEVRSNYREFLNIPQDALVIGRHGGKDTFNLPWVYPAIKNALDKRADLYFLFLNTTPFINHPRVTYLEPTYELERKAGFINTCDAMIHAREDGESFGQAIAEFLALDKPVITTLKCRDQNHKYVLKDKGIYYNNEQELENILTTFTPTNYPYSELVKDFDEISVINKFKTLISEYTLRNKF